MSSPVSLAITVTGSRLFFVYVKLHYRVVFHAKFANSTVQCVMFFAVNR